MGIKKKIKDIIHFITDYDVLRGEIETLQYFLNTYFNASDAKQATGDLRKMQLCDAKLLEIFAKVCEKYNYTYWLGYGTFLGAYRHKGFIPWDDDLDVMVPRRDYERALKEFPIIFKDLGIDVYLIEENIMGRIALGYNCDKTGIWLDVFPEDKIVLNSKTTSNKEEYKKRVRKYIKKYKKIPFSNYEKIDELRNLYIKDENGEEYCVMAPEFTVSELRYTKYSNIYPLKKLMFENCEYNVPGECETVLKDMYGKDYMKFPKRGVEHHKDGGILMSERASFYGVDMNKVYAELTEVLKKI